MLVLAQRPNKLLAQIESEALDERLPVAGALRKCVALGGKAGSSDLRDWATSELRGYEDEAALPPYRVVPAPLRIDGATARGLITGQPIAPSMLPDFVQEKVKEEFKFMAGVGELEAVAGSAEAAGDPVKLQLPMGGDVARLMNAEHQDPSQTILAVYWAVSPATVRGILDQVRTILIQLVAELQASTPTGQDVPTSEATNQAVNVAVHGRRSKVIVNAPQAAEGSTATITADAAAPAESGWWTRARRIGAFVVGVATIAAAVLGYLQLQ
jgi:hypothetical protein